MTAYSFAQYDAFTDIPFGGSQAAIITNAHSIDFQTRQIIAREIGLPATAFVSDISDNRVEAQFVSTVMELPMCGHGTICLITHLAETNHFTMVDGSPAKICLSLPNGNAEVEIARTSHNRVRVMLDIVPPSFKPPPDDIDSLVKILGLNIDGLSGNYPREVAHGDFVHLVVPLKDLSTINAVQPDFDGIVNYCHTYDIETIVVFSTEVENDENSLHVRDFCPAVGVAESAAAGTTNAALTSYLIHHGIVEGDSHGLISLSAEQGLEIKRPSKVDSIASVQDKNILRLQVGGVATKIIDGQIFI